MLMMEDVELGLNRPATLLFTVVLTIQSSYCNPGYHIRFMCSSIDYRCVYLNVHGNEIGDISGDGGRCGFMCQETVMILRRLCFKPCSPPN